MSLLSDIHIRNQSREKINVLPYCRAKIELLNVWMTLPKEYIYYEALNLILDQIALDVAKRHSGISAITWLDTMAHSYLVAFKGML